MAFVEEDKSWIEKQIGRRFPLAILLLVVTCYAFYAGLAALGEGLLVIDGIVITAYFKDIGTEKQTIKMIADESSKE